jgi:hypothetical protein
VGFIEDGAVYLRRVGEVKDDEAHRAGRG